LGVGIGDQKLICGPVVNRARWPAVERWRALAEIDENLIRRDLTTSQRAKLAAKRKAINLEDHPETGRGKAPVGRGGKKVNAKSALSFAEDTARKTGRSRRSVEVDVARAVALGDDLDRIAGTSLDQGAELDALAKIPPHDRQAIISRAADGENVSALQEAASRDWPAAPNLIIASDQSGVGSMRSIAKRNRKPPHG